MNALSVLAAGMLSIGIANFMFRNRSKALLMSYVRYLKQLGGHQNRGALLKLVMNITFF